MICYRSVIYSICTNVLNNHLSKYFFKNSRISAVATVNPTSQHPACVLQFCYHNFICGETAQSVAPQMLRGFGTVSSYNSWSTCLH